VACAFGALHHVARPGQVVADMLRVGAKAVFISDSNSFGQGPRAPQAIETGSARGQTLAPG
jgi:hypothetical protein